jgi:tetratricopeptide (TPR) repeat protein
VTIAEVRRRWVVLRAGRRLQLARYWEADGDLDEAARHGHRALKLLRRCAADAAAVALRVDVAVTVARIDRDRAEYDAAHRTLSWGLALLDASPDESHRDRLLPTVLTVLGDVHRRAGRYRSADRALRRATRLSEGRDPASEAALLMLRGIVAKEQGDYARAAEFYNAVERMQAASGAAPSDAAALQHNLAGLAHARQRYAEAESHARRAVALRRTVPGMRETDLAEDLAVLAAALAGQDRHREACALFGEALTICRAARPPRWYEIAVQLHNLAAIRQACDEPEDAERLYREALAIKERLLGSGHPEIARLLNNLATLLQERQRTTEADTCVRRALAIAERTHPAGHPVTTAIRHNLQRLHAGPQLRQPGRGA